MVVVAQVVVWEWLCRYYRAARRLKLSGHRESSRAEQQSAVEAFLGLRGRQCRHFVCWPPCFGPRSSTQPAQREGPTQGSSLPPRSEVTACSSSQTFQTLAAVLKCRTDHSTPTSQRRTAARYRSVPFLAVPQCNRVSPSCCSLMDVWLIFTCGHVYASNMTNVARAGCPIFAHVPCQY